jgi:hypothetical protein
LKRAVDAKKRRKHHMARNCNDEENHQDRWSRLQENAMAKKSHEDRWTQIPGNGTKNMEGNKKDKR